MDQEPSKDDASASGDQGENVNAVSTDVTTSPPHSTPTGRETLQSRGRVVSDQSTESNANDQEQWKVDSLNKRSTDGGDKNAGLNSLARLERDVTEKEQAKNNSGSVRPGAVAIPGQSGHLALSSLERDIVAKTQSTPNEKGRTMLQSPASLSRLERDVLDKNAVGSIGVSKPGAYAVSGTTPSSLSNLEAQVLSKTESPNLSQGESTLRQQELDMIQKGAIGTSGVSKPGAYSANGPVLPSSLHSLERDVLEKSQFGAPNTRSLNQLENDVQQKRTIATGDISRPGAFAVTGTGLSNLSAMERDILSKGRGDGFRTAGSPSGAGTSGAISLSQLERVVLAKSEYGTTEIRRTGDGPGSSTTQLSLQGFEHDAEAKLGSARSGLQPPVGLGSEPVRPGGDSALHRLETDVLIKGGRRASERNAASAKSPAGQPGDAALRAFEEVILQEQAYLNHSTKFGHGALTERTSLLGEGSLSVVERDVLAKPGGNDGTAMQSLHELESEIMDKSVYSARKAEAPEVVALSETRSLPGISNHDLLKKSSQANVQPYGFRILGQLERDILAKSNPLETAFAGRDTVSSNLPESSLARFEAQVRDKISLSSGGNELSQFERDVGQTQAVRSDTSSPGASLKPLGNREATGPLVSPGSPLGQLERDLLRKGSAFGSTGAPREATRSEVGSREYSTHDRESQSLNRFERDVLVKGGLQSTLRPVLRCEEDGTESTASPLQRFEGDVLAKSRQSRGLEAEQGRPLSSLHDLESELLAKGTSAGAATIPDVGVDRGDAFASMRNLEAEVLDKCNSVTLQASRLPGYDQPLLDVNVGDYDLEYHLSDATGPRQIVETYDDGQPAYSAGPMHESPWIPPDGRLVSSDVRGSPDEQLHTRSFEAPVFVRERPEAPITTASDPEMPLQRDSYGRLSGPIPGGIEAFVAENVVDATGVAVVMDDDEEEEEKRLRQRNNRRFCMVGIAIVAVILAVVVPVVVTLPGSTAPYPQIQESPAPTISPSSTPTTAPTSSFLPRLIEELIPISGSKPFRDRDSPQYRAASWLSNEDEFVQMNGLTVDDPKFLQRYALIVMYFALDGDKWQICGRSHGTCSDGSRVNSWLSSSDECSWYKLSCAGNDNGLLTKFEFGKGKVPFTV